MPLGRQWSTGNLPKLSIMGIVSNSGRVVILKTLTEYFIAEDTSKQKEIHVFLTDHERKSIHRQRKYVRI